MPPGWAGSPPQRAQKFTEQASVLLRVPCGECFGILRLAAAREAAAVSQGHAEVLVGIDGGTIDANFVVEVWAGGTAALADVSDDVTALDSLARGYSEAGQVAIARADAASMVHHDDLAVTAQRFGGDYDPIRGRNDLLAIRAANINTAVKCAFAVKWIDALPEAARDLPFHRPNVRGRVGPDPIRRRGVAGEPHRESDHRGAGQGRGPQSVQLIQRRSDVRLMDLVAASSDHDGLRLESIQGRNFTGNRAQRCHLHVTLFGNLFQAGVARLQLIFLGPQLVELRNLQKHASVRAGNPGEAEKSNGSADGKNVEVMNRNGDFAKGAVVPASDKKDVEAFLQKSFPLVEASGPEFQAKFLECKKACSDHLTFSGSVPYLGKGTDCALFSTGTPTRT